MINIFQTTVADYLPGEEVIVELPEGLRKYVYGMETANLIIGDRRSCVTIVPGVTSAMPSREDGKSRWHYIWGSDRGDGGPAYCADDSLPVRSVVRRTLAGRKARFAKALGL